jgi:hypothetical protein
LRPLARSNSAACFTTSLPLISSSPMLSKPMLGRSLCCIADTSMAPMMANCSKCSGVQLTLAPRSSTYVSPFMVGMMPAMAGRSIPGSVLSTKREIAISAPVLPALTQACAAVLDQIDGNAWKSPLSAQARGGLVHAHRLRRMTGRRLYPVPRGAQLGFDCPHPTRTACSADGIS